MSNARKSRKSHTAARRNEWFGLIYVAPDVVELLAPEGETELEAVLGVVNLALRPVYDSHYEAGWPNAGPVPYVSVYATELDGVPLNIELSTWPGERTTVRLVRETPAERRAQLAGQAIVSAD